MLRILTVALVVFVAFAAPASAQINLFDRPEELGHSMRARQAHQLAAAGRVVLVDVRSPWEWRETGVPASGFAITMHQDRAHFLKQLKDAVANNMSRPLAVICASGARTTFLQKALRQFGFRSPINVAEGMLGGIYGDGWIKNGLLIRQWQGGRDLAPSRTQEPN